MFWIAYQRILDGFRFSSGRDPQEYWRCSGGFLWLIAVKMSSVDLFEKASAISEWDWGRHFTPEEVQHLKTNVLVSKDAFEVCLNAKLLWRALRLGSISIFLFFSSFFFPTFVCRALSHRNPAAFSAAGRSLEMRRPSLENERVKR